LIVLNNLSENFHIISVLVIKISNSKKSIYVESNAIKKYKIDYILENSKRVSTIVLRIVWTEERVR